MAGEGEKLTADVIKKRHIAWRRHFRHIVIESRDDIVAKILEDKRQRAVIAALCGPWGRL